MFIDANHLPEDALLEADVCIVGAGAAGISIALELRHSGLQLLLLESGHFKDDQATQALYAGDVVDEALHSPPDRYRKRVFGGSTTIWGGRSTPLDPIDLEHRPYVPHSGWPIAWSDLAQHYPRANELVEAGAFDYLADSALGPNAPRIISGFNSRRVVDSELERFSCPTNFGARYRHLLAAAQNVRVVFNANCFGIDLTANGQGVSDLKLSTLHGQRFKVAARRYVIATGGIETARLLLASKRPDAPDGVGNQHDVVGRYYMCHIAGNVGRLELNGPVDAVHHGYIVSPDGVYCRRRFSLPAQVQRELGIPSVIARLHFPTITNPAHRSGVLSGLFLAKHLISYEYGKRLQSREATSVKRYAQHLANVITDPFDIAGFLLHWVTRRMLAQRKFPSVILRNKTNVFSLDVHAEQVPNPDSRVMLSSDVDALGMPRSRIDWRYKSDDIQAVSVFLSTFAAELQATETGCLEFKSDQLEADLTTYGAYGGHHIGTARMGDDVRTSVVDPHCQVHGIDNLYLASAAVFPTSGQANPTLTVVALALRLAHHLKQTTTSWRDKKC